MTKAKMKTSKGLIEIKFYDEATPNTVKNFVSLAEDGFYDGLTFHRIVPDFVIQGGDPKGDGTGGPGYKIADEFDNDKQQHVLGALSMANAGPNTNGSQFFIVLNPGNCKHLNGKHTVFGKVTNGMKTVNNIEQGDAIKNVTILNKSETIKQYELEKL